MNTVLRRTAPVFALALCLAAIVSPAPAHASGYTLHTLYAFSALDSNYDNPDGAYPLVGVTLDGQGHLYGTAHEGGTNGLGTLVEYTLATHAFKALINFNGVNGSFPQGSVTLDGHGHLYGTTSHGGSNDDGTLFEYDLASGILTTLVNFSFVKGGAYPVAGVTPDGQGHLYGITLYGGSGAGGTVFQYDLAGGTLTTLVNFISSFGPSPTGVYPLASVTLDGQGHLFGTTQGGGTSNYGTVFQVDIATSALTTLVNFNSSNGAHPYSGVTLDGQGHLYGTTYNGGSNDDGTVYRYDLATQSLATLVTFKGGNGARPRAGVTLDGQGHLFGTTEFGGGYAGTIFKISLATRNLTTLVRSDGSNGANPWGGVTLDSRGSLYGTMYQGGANGNGTVFELTPHP